MFGEVDKLESLFFPVIGANFYGENEFVKELDKLLDRFISVSLGIGDHLGKESLSFFSLFLLLQVRLVLVIEGQSKTRVLV